MDIKTMSVVELKALVYDQLVVAETAQKNIEVLNKELNLRKEVKVEEVKTEVETPTV